MVEMSWKPMLPQEGVFLTFDEEARQAGRCTLEHNLISVLSEVPTT
jgi:hypothetical protein